MSKNYFGLLDSRNTKYQGLIKDDLFAGIGILIDQSLTFALSTWKSSTLNGPSVIIYPGLEIFFGQIYDNKPKGICCFQLNRNQKLFISSQNTDSKSSNKKTTLAYVLDKQSVVEVQKNSSTNQFKLIQVFYIKSGEEELSILSKIFQTQFSKDKKDLTSYLSKYFIETNSLFQLSGKNQIFFGFKDTISLGFKMQTNCPTSVGFFKPFPRNLIYGSKVNSNIALPAKTQIEEGYFDPHTKTFSRLISNEPSLEFQKLSEDYFKKSTTFRNQFVALDHLTRIHRELKSIADGVRYEATKKFGQTLLENDYGSSQQNQNDVVVKEYTLEEMKQEIYKAAAKRQRSHIVSKSPIRQLTKKPSESLYLNSIETERKYTLTAKNRKEPEIINNSTEKMSRRTNEDTAFTEDKKRKFYYQHSKKEDLLKDVNQIVRARKQSEEALLKELINENQKQQKDAKSKKQFDYSDKINERFEGSRKYQRYEPRITPFQGSNGLNQRSALQSSSKRQARYSYLEKTKQDNSFVHERGLQEVIRRDRSMDRISEFQLNREETNSKSHTNLSKYKERHRQQGIVDNLNKKENREKYNYLEGVQNKPEQHLQNKGYERPVPEIKLFGRIETNNKENSTHSQAETKLHPYRDRKDNMNKSSYLHYQGEQKNKYFVASKPLAEKSSNQKEYQKYGQRSSKLQKDYSKQILSSIHNRNSSHQIEANPKLKRTFHYVD